MIQEFYVTNFFSIRERQGISFVPARDGSMLEQYAYEAGPGKKLLKLGIIYGSNASGKSTLLKAFEFFREMMVRRPESKSGVMSYEPFMLDEKSRCNHSRIEISFFIDGLRYVLSVEFDKLRIYEESLVFYPTTMPSTVYKRVYKIEKDVSEIWFGTKSGLSKKSQSAISGNTINNCTVIAAFGQTNVEKSLLNGVYDFFNVGMAPMLGPKMAMLEYVKGELKHQSNDSLKSFLLKMLSISDFNIVDFNVKISEEEITPEVKKFIISSPLSEEQQKMIIQKGKMTVEDFIFSHAGDGGEYKLKENAESNGTKRFLGLSVLLYKLLNCNVFVPIDEVESSIHYELLRYFIKLFLVNSEGSSQLLVTTHDLNLLDEDFIRRDTIWFTEKDQSGATSTKRLSTLGLHKTMSPYNAYRQGKLVNLPFLGGLFLDK